jgi:hypothetical protein
MENTNPSSNKSKEDKIKPTKKKDKAQDLSKDITLKFKYEDFEETGSNYLPRVRKRNHRYYFDNIDILDQSQFRYILNLSDTHNHYDSYSGNNNSQIKWDDINTVIYYSTEIYTCPICLDKRIVSPKITRCGHIFCWPCLVNYYNYWTNVSINKKVPQCPLCKEKLQIHNIKFCEILQSINYCDFISSNSNSELNTRFITFNLVMKDRKAQTLYNTYFDPDLAFLKSNMGKEVFSFLPMENQSEFSFSRIFKTSPSLLQKRYVKIKADLQEGLNEELIGDTDERKVESITKCIEMIDNKIKNLKNYNIDLVSDEEVNSNAEEVNSDEKEKVCEEDVVENKQIEAEDKLDLKAYVYFYQENFGDIYYLHPINQNMLLTEYGSEEHLTTEIHVSIS